MRRLTGRLAAVAVAGTLALGVVAEPVAAHPRRAGTQRAALRQRVLSETVRPVAAPAAEPERVPDAWPDLGPEARCAEAIRDWLLVTPWVPIRCDDEPLYVDGVRKGGLCYCLHRDDPFILIDVTGMDAQWLAWLIAHELGHRWYAERDPDRFYDEPLMDAKGREWTRRCLRCAGSLA